MGDTKDYAIALQPADSGDADSIGPLAGKTLYFPERAEVSTFDSSLADNMFQIALDGRRYCVDQSVLRTLELFREGLPAESVLRSKGNSNSVPGSPQLISRLFDRGLLRTGRSPDEETTQGRGPRARRPAGMFFLIPIFSERVITRIASMFEILFRPAVAWIVGIGIAAAHLAFFFHKHSPRYGPRIGPEQFCCLLGLVLLSLLFHEMGHAAASEHYGIHPHALGFGIFWVYPVLFTDVSGTWKLPRWQRAIVAAAGLYFHLIAASIACLATLFFSSRIPVLLVYSIWLAVFLNGNPFLQFDGYWILTDVLGIPNLRYQTHSVIKRTFARLFGRIPPDQGLWNSSKRTHVPIFLYATAYCGFIVYAVNVLVRRILLQLWISVPLAWNAVARLIEKEQFDLAAVATLWRAAVIIVTIAGLLRMLYRGLAYLYRNVRSVRPAVVRRTV